MKMFFRAVIAGLLVLMSVSAHAGDAANVERGDDLRTTLLDAARARFEAEASGPVEFVVNRLRTNGDWAFGDVSLQRPGGAAIDWSKTTKAEALKEGMFDPGASFFLLKRDNTAWIVVAIAVGPTDVAWEGWRQEFQLPEALFIQD